jgi:hypothetical protein
MQMYLNSEYGFCTHCRKTDVAATYLLNGRSIRVCPSCIEMVAELVKIVGKPTCYEKTCKEVGIADCKICKDAMCQLHSTQGICIDCWVTRSNFGRAFDD